MGEVLSQSEIDNLLKALSSGDIDIEEMEEEDTRKILNYDFKRPSKFSKDHLRTLNIIFEHYGRLIATNLPVYLRKNIHVSVASAEAVIFSEFSNALSNPVILSIVNFHPLQGNIILELTTNLGYAIIDRMLGGEGCSLEKSREFSEIEIGILEKIMTVCVQLLRDPWKNVIEINPYLERIETNAQFAQMIAPNEMIAIISLNVQIGEEEGFMNICVPYFTIESIMEKLSTKHWYSTMLEMSEVEYKENIEALISKVDMPVRTVLGNSKITVSDFINLQIGDIIKLDSKIDKDLDIFVGNIKKFTGLPGASKDKYAVRVTSVIREEEK